MPSHRLEQQAHKFGLREKEFPAKAVASPQQMQIVGLMIQKTDWVSMSLIINALRRSGSLESQWANDACKTLIMDLQGCLWGNSLMNHLAVSEEQAPGRIEVAGRSGKDAQWRKDLADGTWRDDHHCRLTPRVRLICWQPE
jgi:hypothetical protein